MDGFGKEAKYTVPCKVCGEELKRADKNTNVICFTCKKKSKKERRDKVKLLKANSK
jgi:hypothetical protein